MFSNAVQFHQRGPSTYMLAIVGVYGAIWGVSETKGKWNGREWVGQVGRVD